MNKIDFTQPGGFPLDQDVLDFMQDNTMLTGQLANLAGDKVIIAGCETVGGDITDGFVVIDGEILPFAGGTPTDNVTIVEQTFPLTFTDASTPQVLTKRYATFSSDGALLWADFKRFVLFNGSDYLAKDNADEFTPAEDYQPATKKYVDDSNTAGRLASGSYHLGDVAGGGQLFVVPIGTVLPDTNYMVLFSLVSLSGSAINDSVNCQLIKNKTTATFSVYLNEISALTQNLQIDFVIFKL